MKKQLFITALLFASTAASSAHAGMFEWVDEMFTFREDQKARVAPQNSLPPQTVYTPSMDSREQQAAQYYVQGDLMPKDYLNGSASKVMRPNTLPPSQRVATSSYAHLQGGGYVPGNQPGQIPQGYEAMVQRDRMNQVQNRANSRIYVGDPGTNPNGQRSEDSAYQPAKIGQPVSDWRDAPNAFAPTPRPGDYDYEHARRQPAQASQPAQAARSPWGQSGDLKRYSSLADDRRATRPAYAAAPTTNAQGQVTEYQVQRGDTLSGISDKPQIYGDWAMWPLIWDANRGTVKDPDMIRPQQRLDIPRDYDKQDTTDARQRAWGKGKVIYLDDGK